MLPLSIKIYRNLLPASAMRYLVSAMAICATTLSGCAQPDDMEMLISNIHKDPSMTELIAGAQREGTLTVIGLPHDWCNYGALINGFKAAYNLNVIELNPEASSTEEINAIKAERGGMKNGPDVVDIAHDYILTATRQRLLTPYKVSFWDNIPAQLKEPTGYWTADYFGTISFEINRDRYKTALDDWKQLTDPLYSVALAGDPRQSNEAAMAIYAAGLSLGGVDTKAATSIGLLYFNDLSRAGNLSAYVSTDTRVAAGMTPLALRWDYKALTSREKLRDHLKIDVVIPKTGVVGDYYAQAISAYAEHPYAAKLWMEYIYSTEGQLAYLQGFCHPARYLELADMGVIPSALAAQLPPVNAYRHVSFPTLQDKVTIMEKIAHDWDGKLSPIIP